ncbi:MAG: uroporphyrinogen-III synthase [Bacteroidota bacterium]
MKNYSVLSTKILTPIQEEQLRNAKIRFEAYDAIHIQLLDVEVQSHVKNAIITSQNAARAILRKKIVMKNTYCVGHKTKALLEENQIAVIETGQNAADLAHKIIEKHHTKSFTFFCGNRKMETLPTLLEKHAIAIQEIEVYKTHLNPKTIENHFNGILFFSPSAVTSYMLKNTIENSTAFCIGTTTAAQAEHYTKNIAVAPLPTVEHVLAQVIKHKKTHD